MPVAPSCLVNHGNVMGCRLVMLHPAPVYELQLPISYQFLHRILLLL